MFPQAGSVTQFYPVVLVCEERLHGFQTLLVKIVGINLDNTSGWYIQSNALLMSVESRSNCALHCLPPLFC